ncbi:TPA: HAD hydrolase-like protein, partial [Mannheimia haemolytica]|nr:HAD hydrolase-like protein [Mannheimia haemolytica]
QDLNIDPSQSYMVGDKLEDILAAEAAGVKTKVLVRTDKAVTEEGQAKADLVLDSLVDLVKYIK